MIMMKVMNYDDDIETDNDDRQLIELELEKDTECHTTTNQVPDSLLNYQDFLESVLPLPDVNTFKKYMLSINYSV